MVLGHPLTPTIGRSLIKEIEEAVFKGGGYVLVTGFAAGDTGVTLIVKVD
jgi:hypothetical protein